MKGRVLVFLFAVCLSGSLFAGDIDLVQTAYLVALSSCPAVMTYDEDGAMAPKHIEFAIEEKRGSYHYIVTSSTDDGQVANGKDSRKLFQTGDTDKFNLLEYVEQGNIFDTDSSITLTYRRDASESGEDFRVYDISYNYLEPEGGVYPLDGELWVLPDSLVPRKLLVEYSECPENVFGRRVEVGFSGDSAEDCRIVSYKSETDGKYMVFKYTINVKRSFTY